jgi:hypothetical protein
LRRYHCDPIEEGGTRTQRLLERDSQESTVRVHDFDPEMKTSRVTYIEKKTGSEWILLQMFHDGSIPIYSGVGAPHAKGIASSMLRIWAGSPRLAISIGILGGRFKELDRGLSLGYSPRLADSLHGS